jgi:hypothetical protein
VLAEIRVLPDLLFLVPVAELSQIPNLDRVEKDKWLLLNTIVVHISYCRFCTIRFKIY